mmetsp:Transcript_32568/g.52909  ORF Transcript_32568/g.52909 Transcript_32568/m.52909 type:complete len:238 (+) Transcript_32568:326-1039(+)
MCSGGFPRMPQSVVQIIPQHCEEAEVKPVILVVHQVVSCPHKRPRQIRLRHVDIHRPEADECPSSNSERLGHWNYELEEYEGEALQRGVDRLEGISCECCHLVIVDVEVMIVVVEVLAPPFPFVQQPVVDEENASLHQEHVDNKVGQRSHDTSTRCERRHNLGESIAAHDITNGGNDSVHREGLLAMKHLPHLLLPRHLQCVCLWPPMPICSEDSKASPVNNDVDENVVEQPSEEDK